MGFQGEGEGECALRGELDPAFGEVAGLLEAGLEDGLVGELGEGEVGLGGSVLEHLEVGRGDLSGEGCGLDEGGEEFGVVGLGAELEGAEVVCLAVFVDGVALCDHAKHTFGVGEAGLDDEVGEVVEYAAGGEGFVEGGAVGADAGEGVGVGVVFVEGDDHGREDREKWGVARG